MRSARSGCTAIPRCGGLLAQSRVDGTHLRRSAGGADGERLGPVAADRRPRRHLRGRAVHHRPHRDLLIVDGRNHYPDDIEFTISGSPPDGWRPSLCGTTPPEKLVAVAGIKPPGGTPGRCDREAARLEAPRCRRGPGVHGVRMGDLVLVGQGSLCRSPPAARSAGPHVEQQYRLRSSAGWTLREPGAGRDVASEPGWSTISSSTMIGLDRTGIDCDAPLSNLAVGSADAVVMIGGTGCWTACRRRWTSAVPTVNALATYLSGGEVDACRCPP